MSKRQWQSVAGILLLAGMNLFPMRAEADLCPNPGGDGDLVGGGGTVNTYYTPGPGSQTITGGSTATIDLVFGQGATSTGPSTSLNTQVYYGDLLLLIQMQDAVFDSSNTNAYGDGVTTTDILGPASGAQAINGSGLYEYVVVADGGSPANYGTVFGGGLTAVPIQGTGTGGHTLNSYVNSNYNGVHGQKRFQVVRVPKYGTVTLGSNVTCSPWNGSSGGIIAIDCAADFNFSTRTLDASGRGFRGGWGEKTGGGTPSSNTDYRNTTAVLAHGFKAEGIAGAGQKLINFAGTLDNSGVEGYPLGCKARGAPGNAGGGGTDDSPASNTLNSGAGGGGNGGRGARGGNTKDTFQPVGGFGGSRLEYGAADSIPPFDVGKGQGDSAWGAKRVAMGGGGGSGVKNDNAKDNHGALGGGIVLVRTNTFSGTGAVNVNGANAIDAGNNGGGGGGAGGSAILVSKSTDWSGVGTLTVTGNGGGGANAGVGTKQYGPGGGGGGGVVLISTITVGPSTALNVSSTGGASGTTFGGLYGAEPNGQTGTDTPGSGGNPYINPSDIPGAHGGADCNSMLAVADSYFTPSATVLTANGVGGNPPGVLANDTIPPAGTYTVVIDTGITGAGATLVINLSTGNFTYTPGPAPVYTDTFSYHIHRAAPSTNSNTVVVTIQVGGEVAPVATDDSYTVAEDGVLTANGIGPNPPGVLANDTDGNPLDTLTAIIVTGVSHGALALNPNGTFTYQPDPDYHGSDGFTYKANDGTLDSNVATVVITITSVNDPPVAVNDAYTTVENAPLTVPAPQGLLANDTDVDADTLTVNLATVTTPTVGSVVVNADGSFTYTPPPGVWGQATFTYQCNDGTVDSNVATVTIDIAAGNKKHKAGYCGLMGLELLIPLGMIAVYRRKRMSAGRRPT